ncbi:hypothetical protein B0H17DRAFT_1268146 [Mycena rosella]|uniref:Uncharacterized protein n=1 Tax=Mycena rosella TaxID=1033263 RepID=A0AAD7G2U2_MYCRO|nr:hypothetical protein B0H17DRAFT_1268146 [Mycena rosella]
MSEMLEDSDWPPTNRRIRECGRRTVAMAQRSHHYVVQNGAATMWEKTSDGQIRLGGFHWAYLPNSAQVLHSLAFHPRLSSCAFVLQFDQSWHLSLVTAAIAEFYPKKNGLESSYTLSRPRFYSGKIYGKMWTSSLTLSPGKVNLVYCRTSEGKSRDFSTVFSARKRQDFNEGKFQPEFWTARGNLGRNLPLLKSWLFQAEKAAERI